MLKAASRAGSQHELLHKLLPNFTECSCVQTLHLIFSSNLPIAQWKVLIVAPVTE